MNVRRIFGIAGLIGLGFCGCTRPKDLKAEVYQSLDELCSKDFTTMRRAQVKLKKIGSPALEPLLSTLRASTNHQQFSLGCFVLGDISADAYFSTLRAFVVTGAPSNICAALEYPNDNVFRKYDLDTLNSLRCEVRTNWMSRSENASVNRCIGAFLDEMDQVWSEKALALERRSWR